MESFFCILRWKESSTVQSVTNLVDIEDGSLFEVCPADNGY